MKAMFRILTLVVVTAAAVSCSVTRDCKAPELNLPDGIANFSTADSLSVADIDWWEFYGDSLLRNLIGKALECNKDIIAAGARVEQARALLGAATADMLPTVSGRIYADRETNHYHDKGFSGDPETGIKATARWEIDLWGNLRWARNGRKASYLASVEAQRAMRMALVAEVAADYFTLTALDNELAIVKRTLFTRSEGVRQARLRFEGGLTSETVYQQAQVEYASTAALVPQLEQRIESMQNAIAVLVGEYPGYRIERQAFDAEGALPEHMPAGASTELLMRRPDVRQARQELQSVLASAGVAWADRFPSLALTLTGGVENNSFAHLLQSPFSYMLGEVVGTIFDFGRKQRRYRAAVAAYDAAKAGYEKKVLEVFRETADAISTYSSSLQTARLRADLRDAAWKYVELAHLQYRGGSLNYLDVLDAQRRFFDAQIGLSNAVRDEYLALVNLYKTLGGGWREPQAESQASKD